MKRKDFLRAQIMQRAKRAVESYALYRENRGYVNFNSLAMECFQVANYVIDLAEEVVAEKSLGFPSTYKETFVILHRAGYLGDDEKDVLIRIVMLRNRIAHEYHIIKEDELMELYSIVASIEGIVEKLART